MLAFVADDYEDASGYDKSQLQNFLRGYFLAHPKVELLVNVESLEFPADGLAQAEISVTRVSLSDPDSTQRLKVEFRRRGGDWRVQRADRVATLNNCDRRHFLRFNPDRIQPTKVSENAVIVSLSTDARPSKTSAQPRAAARRRARAPADSGGFSIESTTMRLKSMRLRRAENEKQEAERALGPPGFRRNAPRRTVPSGRVRHDERGVAVWDWAVASGEFQTLSATRALKKLEVAELKIEDTQRDVPALTLEKAGRDKGGGFDPYNQRGSGKRVGEAAERQGVTGAKDKAAVLDQLLGNKK